ncbi:hypothetical protein BKA69DRAFT_1035448 [Paraphysoderma sedebokerense]|nr:hypothetical protein BKA69DRAFT_1035448 [Paraphysoderma sedebokerense]
MILKPYNEVQNSGILPYANTESQSTTRLHKRAPQSRSPDSSSTPTSGSPSVQTILLIILPIAAFLIIVGFIIFLRRRIRRRQEKILEQQYASVLPPMAVNDNGRHHPPAYGTNGRVNHLRTGETSFGGTSFESPIVGTGSLNDKTVVPPLPTLNRYNGNMVQVDAEGNGKWIMGQYQMRTEFHVPQSYERASFMVW